MLLLLLLTCMSILFSLMLALAVNSLACPRLSQKQQNWQDLALSRSLLYETSTLFEKSVCVAPLFHASRIHYMAQTKAHTHTPRVYCFGHISGQSQYTLPNPAECIRKMTVMDHCLLRYHCNTPTFLCVLHIHTFFFDVSYLFISLEQLCHITNTS